MIKNNPSKGQSEYNKAEKFRINPRHILLGFAIFLLALAPRLFIVISNPPVPEIVLSPLNDSTDYVFLSEMILEGRYSSPGCDPTAFRPPLYPLFLAVIQFISGKQDLFIITLVQAVLGGVCAILVYVISLKVTKRMIPAVLAGIVYALYPAYIYQASLILSEVFGRFMILVTILLLWQATEKPRAVKIYASGIIFALTIMVKPVFLATFPFVALWFGWKMKGDRKEKISATLLGFVLPVIIICGLWTFRNFMASGRIVPVSTNYPITFAQGVTRFSYYTNKWYDEDRLMPAPDNYLNLTQMRFYNGIENEVAVGRSFASRALSYIAENPGFFLVLTIRKTLHYWSPFIRNAFWKQAAAFLSMAPVLIFGWIGVIYSIKKKKEIRDFAILALIIALTTMIPYILSQPDVRYRLGITDPLWIITGAWYFCWLIKR